MPVQSEAKLLSLGIQKLKGRRRLSSRAVFGAVLSTFSKVVSVRMNDEKRDSPDCHQILSASVM